MGPGASLIPCATARAYCSFGSSSHIGDANCHDLATMQDKVLVVSERYVVSTATNGQKQQVGKMLLVFLTLRPNRCPY